MAKKTVTATDIIDSVTEWSVAYVVHVNKDRKVTEAAFEAAVLRVFEMKLKEHLKELDQREPGKAALVRQRFLAEYEQGRAA